MFKRSAILIAVTMVLVAATARAEYGRTPDTQVDPRLLTIDEATYLGTKIDGDYVLTGSDTRDFLFGDLLGKPLILVLSYYSCDGACPTVNANLGKALGEVTNYSMGPDFTVLTVSFDATDVVEDAMMFEKMAGIKGGDSTGWKVAVMKDRTDIERLTGSLGFKYFWSKRDKLFLHPSVYVFVSPEGRVTRFLYSAAAGSRDIEVAIAEAGLGKTEKSKIRDLTDLLLVACYSYNYREGKYTLNYPLFIASGSLLGGLSLIGLSIVISKKKARR